MTACGRRPRPRLRRATDYLGLTRPRSTRERTVGSIPRALTLCSILAVLLAVPLALLHAPDWTGGAAAVCAFLGGTALEEAVTRRERRRGTGRGTR